MGERHAVSESSLTCGGVLPDKDLVLAIGSCRTFRADELFF